MLIRINFRASVSESMRRGVGCPVPPTISLEVDPATLSEADRALLADRLNDDGDVCRRDEEGYAHNSRWRIQATAIGRHEGKPCETVIAATPRIEDLLDAIRAEEHAIATYAERKAADITAKTESDRQEALNYMHATPCRQTQTPAVVLHENGVIDSTDSSYYSQVLAKRTAEYQREYVVYHTHRLSSLTAAEQAAYLARCQQYDAESEARQKVAFNEAAAALLAEHWQPRLDWIATHGSTRLKRLAAEGIDFAKTYSSELEKYEAKQFDGALAAERPGWKLVHASSIDRNIADVSTRALTLLDAARVLDATAKLARHTGEGKYVAVADFRGKLIMWPCD